MVHSVPTKPHGLSIVIPAYNEEQRIGPTLRSLKEHLDRELLDSEVIIVDDGSSDGTSAVVNRTIANWPQFRCLTLPRNEGKGWAIREGVLAATKPNLLFMDADCSTDLAMIPRLFEKLSGENPIIIGSRDKRGAEILEHQSFLREYTAKGFNLWIQLFLLPGVWDTQCGFKMFKTAVAKQLFTPLGERRFGFDVEVLYRARRAGIKIMEVPVRWTNVLNSRVSPLRDGSRMALQVLQLRIMGLPEGKARP